MYKVISFTRVSSQHQDLEQQNKEVYNAIIHHGYKDEEILYIEQKESAIKLSIEERVSVQKLFEYVRTYPTIEYVFIYEISRLSRQQRMLFEIRDFLIEHKVNLKCLKPEMTLLDKDYKLSQTASIVFSLFTSISESEMMLKKERMRRGAEHKHEQGKYWGGSVAIGYKIQGEYLVIDEEGAEWVRRIYNEYADGVSVRALARKLQAEGWRTDSAFLTVCQSILNILHREYYCGDKWHPQIVSRELYDKVQEKCSNKATYKKEGNEALLKGLIYDKQSGYLMSSNMTNQQYFSKRYGHCTISMKAADTIFGGLATEWYNKWKEYKKEEMRENVRINIERQNNIINNTKDKMTKIYDKIERIEERYIDNKITKEHADTLEKKVWEQMNELKRTLENAENEKIRLEESLKNDTDAVTLRDKCLAMIKYIYVERVNRFVCCCMVENKMTGEKRTYNINTRTVSVLDLKVELRPAIQYKK